MADKLMRVSDLSGELATERVRWGFRSKQYVLDLTDEELAQFEQLLKPYIEASRAVRRKRKQSAAKDDD